MKLLRLLALFAVLISTAQEVGKPSAHTKGTPTGKPTGPLKPGEYWWRPQLSPSGPLIVLVSVPEQVTHVYRNGIWLKTAAIISVSVGHFGFFFMEDDRWWSVFGRLATPTFFFLLGYAQTRTVPLNWIWLGVMLTLLESWNADWTWVAPNILLSLALIRIARPYVEMLVQTRGWAAFILLVSILLAVLPVAAKIVDYGGEGWLWALFGLCQRQYAGIVL